MAYHSGGESSVFLNLLGEAGFARLSHFVLTSRSSDLRRLHSAGREVENPAQRHRRVGHHGSAQRLRRQIDSTISRPIQLEGGPLEQVYIRAPRIERVGPAWKCWPSAMVTLC